MQQQRPAWADMLHIRGSAVHSLDMPRRTNHPGNRITVVAAAAKCRSDATALNSVSCNKSELVDYGQL